MKGKLLSINKADTATAGTSVSSGCPVCADRTLTRLRKILAHKSPLSSTRSFSISHTSDQNALGHRVNGSIVSMWLDFNLICSDPFSLLGEITFIHKIPENHSGLKKG